MATKFFKKFEPNLGVSIGGKQVVKFPTIDGIVGYLATDDERIQLIFNGHIEAGRYGISEITWDEFNEAYVKKKTVAPQLRKPWREEFSSQGTRSANLTSPGAGRSVAGVDGTKLCGRIMADDGAPTEQVVKAVTAAAEAVAVPFQPTVGKREPRI